VAGRIILETARLQLREFDEGDLATFYVLGSDPDVIRYTGGVLSGLKSIEHAREALFSRPIADYRKHGFGRWACVHKENGQVIGFSGLKYLDELGEVDIGYRFLPEYWGFGLATESGAAVLDFGFTRLNLQRIIGLVDPANVASVRVLEKLGLTYAGTIDYLGDTAAKYIIEGRRL
jgi:RimJ/RimL family protein N-acetyltransferase